MNVQVLNGSPHTNFGVTGALLSFVIEGLKEADAEVESHNVYDMHIEPCRGCLSCWMKTPGVCVHRDDMVKLYDKLLKADIVVIGTPVYVDGMTGMMKLMFDRLIPILTGPFEIRDDHCRHILPEGKVWSKVLLVSGSGFTELDNFDPLVMHVRAICRNMGWDYVGALLRPYGWYFGYLMSRGQPVQEVLDSLKEAGKQLAERGSIDEEIIQNIRKDYTTRDQLIEFYNGQYADQS